MRTVDQDSLVEVEVVEALELHQIHLAALGVMISSRHWPIARPTKLRSHGLFPDARQWQKSSNSRSHSSIARFRIALHKADLLLRLQHTLPPCLTHPRHLLSPHIIPDHSIASREKPHPMTQPAKRSSTWSLPFYPKGFNGNAL